MYIRLDFNNSDYILLFKQDIPTHRHRIIRAYHVELLQKISDSGFPVWPPEEIAASMNCLVCNPGLRSDAIYPYCEAHKNHAPERQTYQKKK
jgi:hypothetical protein